MDLTAFHKISYGLFVVTAHEGDRDNGCVTNTVMQVTTTPNRITVAVNKQNYTHDMIRRTGKFNVSVLAENAKFDIFKHWGFQSGRDIDKAVGITFSRAENGVIYVTEGVNAVISAEVTGAESLSDTPSATYAFYHRNIKPAPERPKKKGWVCTICGYVYEGDTLPEGFTCPLCKHPASDFKEME